MSHTDLKQRWESGMRRILVFIIIYLYPKSFLLWIPGSLNTLINYHTHLHIQTVRNRLFSQPMAHASLQPIHKQVIVRWHRPKITHNEKRKSLLQPCSLTLLMILCYWRRWNWATSGCTYVCPSQFQFRCHHTSAFPFWQHFQFINAFSTKSCSCCA